MNHHLGRSTILQHHLPRIKKERHFDIIMVMGSIIAITDQVLFKLSKVRLGRDGIITLELGELLDRIIRNIMRSTCYLRKVKGFVKFHHFLILVNMTLYKYVMDI